MLIPIASELLFCKKDFIENQQNTKLTKTIYRAIYKLYNPPPTSKYRHYT